MRNLAYSIRFGGLAVFAASMALACGASKTDIGTNVDLDSGDPTDTGSTGFDVSGEGSSDAPAFSGLEVVPSNETVYIDTAAGIPGVPAVLTYKAILHNDDGTTTDVSSSTKFALDDPTLGTFAGATFTSVSSLPGTAAVLGTTTVVRANSATKAGAANLTVVQLRKTGDKRDFFFLVPYMGAPSPTRDVLKFGTNIKQVDIAVVMDTTGSMGGAIDALKTSLSTTVFPDLKKAIPSVGIGVVDHKDCSDTWAVKVLNVVNTDITKSQASVGTMSATGGGDEPESQIGGMQHALTGEAITGCVGMPTVHKPAAGTFGGVDFRPGSLPVVTLVTDAHWHDPDGSATAATLKAAYVKNNARFVSIMEAHYESFYTDLENQANDLSDGTKSNVPTSAFGTTCGAGKCCTDVSGAARAATGPGGTCRLNFKTMNGVGLGSSLTKAIQAISVGSVFDVTAKASNDPTNADGVDATQFIKALRAMSEGDAANGCPAATTKDTDGDTIDDTFISVKVGTPVCFEVLPKMNTTVKPKDKAQFFNAFIDVLGMPGSVKLDQRIVLFLVPPTEIIAK